MYIVTECLISFALAFIVAFLSTPIAKRIALKLNAIDVPKDNRRMHSKPIPRLGGLAIINGFFVSIIFSIVTSFFDGFKIINIDFRFVSFLGGLVIIIMGSCLDDIKPLDAKIKLIFQVLAAIVIVVGGTRIETFTNPFSDSGFSNLPLYISYPLTIFWIVGITNALNLMDGLDGLAAGVASISSLSLFLVSMISGLWDTAIITAALAASSLGFLPYNFNPAKIFMGDTGSAFLGFSLAVISIQSTLKTYTAIAIVIPMLVLGLPLFDTIFAIIRRLITGKSPMKADRGHIHHKLIDMGLTHRQSVVVLYTASSILGLTAIVMAEKGAISALILIIAVAIFIVGGGKYMNIMDDDSHLKNINSPNEKEQVTSKTIK